MFPITFTLSRDRGEPLYEQIYSRLKQDIESKRLPSGSRIPSVRQMAEHLQVSRHTVETAYLQLTAEGYIDNRPRSGYYVAEIEDHLLDFLDSKTIHHQKVPFTKGHVEMVKAPPDDQPPVLYDFRNGAVDTTAFPWSTWRKTVDEVYQSEERDLLLCRERLGDVHLREDIARYLYQVRGVRCRPDQIVLAAGSQHCLSMISVLVKSFSDSVCMEDPGCANTRQLFRWNGLKTLPVPLEEDGIRIDALKKSGTNVVFVTPSHQFPCGMIMSIQKRIQLLKWAYEQDGFIIEDDYDGEFCYHRRPIPALQGLDSNGRVIYVGSFTKCFIPTLRIAYMVLPEEWMKRFTGVFSMYDQPTSRLHQQTLHFFFKKGHFERHMRRMRTLYRRKHDLLYQNLNGQLPAVQIIGKHAGLHFLLELGASHTEHEWLEKARLHGVKVYPTSHYWTNHSVGKKPVLLMDYGGVPIEHIPDAVKRLVQAWK
ncbi:MocR-like pyridoxine biosynthesis transcription factor PdxR [Desmospora profundinema]|uniref:GntR family transcriptional regulator/MocR family aminotransferase n=1 Tax=Desmospora profundinema TaxID=1571184 RepID=A0ABU1INX1_9BACL|nr:PLP-dependent aminotransferase family protein [Desmospora profundinema]MDR6226472.1 GntR family transcriptional regulator/MocR family aminotransferase [Desmospora profundinema]